MWIHFANNIFMGIASDQIQEETRKLVDEYRARCLWFLRIDYYPETREEILRTLDYIRRYGDNQAFRKAGEIREWHLQNTRSLSADS